MTPDGGVPVMPEPTAGASWFRARTTDLVAETLSDETLVIDTASGVFFSLRGVDVRGVVDVGAHGQRRGAARRSP